MRIVIAPDKFKGSLSAADVTEAIRRGLVAVWPDAQTTACPMADGGEGTVAAMIAATGGQLVEATVTGPLPTMRVTASFGLLGDGATAVIEMSAASGLALVPEAMRTPLRTTTFGTGELIRLAADRGVRRVLLGIGGSATTDAGLGALQAMGMQIVLDSGAMLNRPMVGADLANVRRVIPPVDWQLPEILIACDVENPLCGEQGAARVYGPQKGASPDDVVNLDRWLAAFAARMGKTQVAEMKGSGAAGGLGFGLCAFIPGTRMAGGFALVAEALHFVEKLRGADLCITGEGLLDSSSLKGKTAAGVARACHAAGVPCVVLAGGVDGEAEKLLREQTGAVSLAIVDRPMALAEAMARTAELVERAAGRVAALRRC